MEKDRFVPDWDNAPEWAHWHAIDDDGSAWWFGACPHVEEWWDEDEKGNDILRWNWTLDGEWTGDTYWLDDIDGEYIKGLDWRNSLRHRPEAR